MKSILIVILIIFSGLTMAQNFDFEYHLYQTYDQYKEKTLSKRRFKHSDLMELISVLKKNKAFNIKIAGKSVEGRELNLITIGKGQKKVFLWSQMHGDEPTATAAIFDIFNFFNATENKEFCDRLFERVKLYFLPMVNPDGAERFTRRNYYDIDLNRDASRLICPESKILKSVFDSVKADFGFNLHDQSPRYSVGNSFRPATISFLAPAFNYEKDFNQIRDNAVRLIGNMYKVLDLFIPGHIAKYSDEYEPRAFGDSFQKWGTSTILIESGGWKDDPEKQFIRKLNYISILSAIKSIAEDSYQTTSKEIYDSIPFNDKFIFDVILRNLTIKNGKEKVKVDVAINLDEFEKSESDRVYYKSQVADIGDLSTYYGYNDYDLNGYCIEETAVYKEKVFKLDELKKIDFKKYYDKGISTLIVKKMPGEKFTQFPINVVTNKKTDTSITIGEPANFILKRNNKIEYIIINGFINKPDKNWEIEGNGLLLNSF